MRRRKSIHIIKLNRKFLFLIGFIIIIFATMFIIRCYRASNIFSYRGSDVIVVDPGHGGIDGGTSVGELLEKNINLDIGLKLKKELKKEGYKVIMTREKDESLEKYSDINSSRYRKDLNARKCIVNDNDPIVFVSIHVNSSKKPSARGVKIYHYPTSIEGKKLAQNICYSVDNVVYEGLLRENSIMAEVIGENYYILRETENTGVLVEVGFITNEEDRKLITDDKYQDKIVLAIKEGINEYIKKVK